jgi:hypothetical protein
MYRFSILFIIALLVIGITAQNLIIVLISAFAALIVFIREMIINRG